MLYTQYFVFLLDDISNIDLYKKKLTVLFHALLLIKLILFASDCFTHKRTKRNGRII